MFCLNGWQARFIELLHNGVKLVKASTGLSAAIYTQLTDVEGEVNGIFTYDRKVLTGPLVMTNHGDQYDYSW